jgi:enoyl-CoA hydratase/carnithine racemase
MIDVVRQGAIAIVTLRRPPANAMNLELTEEIAAVFQRLVLRRRRSQGRSGFRPGASAPDGGCAEPCFL